MKFSTYQEENANENHVICLNGESNHESATETLGNIRKTYLHS